MLAFKLGILSFSFHRLYFGESVALYFAWIGFYTQWLIPIGIFGLLTMCIAIAEMNSSRQV